MSDTEIDQNLHDSDQDVSEHHPKLIGAVEQLDKGRRVKKAERSEPSIQVSEYHLVKSGVTDKDSVRIQDLVNSLGRKKDQNNISKKLRYIQQKNRVLPKPLEKPAAERIRRTIGYDNVKKDLTKWNSIVARNRTADQLFFPLKHTEEVKDFNASKIPEFLKGFKTKSDLMKKFEEVDSSLLYPPVEEEEKDKYKMTMEELILKRKEAARLRAQQSYQEAKAHRQRKIKSKKFHRIQKKDKIKQQLKEFEKLQNTNPEQALEKLEQLDKTRAEERMSLRHKNTGQWAKNQQIRAKYNKETRQVLANQLAISKELTQKLKRIDSDNDEDEEKDNEDEILLNDKENNLKTESEIDDFIENYRRYWDEKQKEDQKKEKKNEDKKKEDKSIEISNKIISEKEEITLHSNKVHCKTIEKNNLQDNLQDNLQKNVSDVKSQKKEKKNENKKKKDKNIEISNKVISEKEEITLHSNKVHCKTIEKNNLQDILQDNLQKNVSDVKSENLMCNAKGATSAWNVEECNDKTESKLSNKKYKSQSIDEMFDFMEEKLKHKVNLKLQKVKNKLKTKSNVKKHEKEKKENEDDSLNLEFENFKQKPNLDCPLEETTSRENVQNNDKDQTSLKSIANTEQEPTNDNYEVEIDPNKYLKVKPKYFKTEMPDVVTGEEENSEQEEEMRKIISEAFADDDVVAEFRKEQEEEMEKSQLKNIDLSLPGWGSWTGPNIKKSKIRRKKKRFILNVPKEVPRNPENQGKVIIFKDDDKKLRKHLVNELPHPFTRVKDYEASIRAPISRNFVPMNAHLRIIQPTINTKLGHVIEPMDENALVKKPTLKKLLKRRIDKKNNDRKNTMKNIKKRRKTNVTA